MQKKIIFSIFIFLIGFSVSPTSFAATADSVQQQINNTNSQIQALDKEIAAYQAQISETNAQSNTLASLIKELTLSRNKLVAERTQTEKKITAAGYIISAINSDIGQEQSTVSKSKASLSKMISELDQRDKMPLVVQILSKENFSEASREYANIIVLNAQMHQSILDAQAQVEQLNVSKSKKVVEQTNLSKLKKTLVEKQKAVDIAKQAKNTLLAQTKGQESNYKKLLAESQKKRDAFEKDLENYESQLKFILNPNLLPSTGGNGVLSWPLDNVYVTQLFGKTVSSKRLYVSGSHSGVDFRASIGTRVMAMGSGTVIGTGDTDIYCRGASFGKWVFIKYDNGLSSAFGHLSYIEATAGQQVHAGDVVALSGNTGHSTAPHLHTTIYASQGAEVRAVPSLSCSGKNFIMPIAATNAYLDPMLYLPPLPKSKIKNDAVKD